MASIFLESQIDSCLAQSMVIEPEIPTVEEIHAFFAQNDIPLQQRIDALLNEIFGELEAGLDAQEPEGQTEDDLLESDLQYEYDNYNGYDEYDQYHAPEEEETCVCNYAKCQGDCGTLRCGCIDVCRGRCGAQDNCW